MKVLIIDDERLARKELSNLLAEYKDIEILGEAANADEAEEMIDKLNPDMIFLDIQMPGRTGFELLETLEKTPKVIFTTAYDEYALKAFEFNALDYLLKPIEPKRLTESVNKIRKEVEAQEEKQKNGSQLTVNDQVFVKDGDNCWFVKLKDVRLFESDGNYIKVYFDKNKPMIHKSLNALDEKLDNKHFFRVSRKHIINLEWIDEIETWFNGGLMVKLKGGDKVEVSRRQATKFKDLMSL
ncbi:LytTR family transcriptional regulator DNA-binding domain-containing protein [Marivirga sp.]|uniref:LytR/AlgR family response regulator transcription factor n=1 Tax=Marivirga sp. TaxID=2018662 RepID=UPI0025E09280|nr:LytTR family transcriptional regulator DNA-binding domain-containing protein [Marivirga sp.]